MKPRDLHSYLDKLFLPQLFVDSALNGLQIEGSRLIARAAVGVSASLAFIEKAIALEADALIVHHGLFWQKQPSSIVGGQKNRIKRILENDISLFAYHLPLDAHETIGNNYKAALDLRGRELKKFGQHNGIQIGVEAYFDDFDCEIFQHELERYYGHKATVAAFGKATIGRVAFLSGGGWRWLEEAIEKGIDALVTGSFDEPAWAMAKEGNIHLFALGHFATERIGPMALVDHLKKELPAEIFFIDEENPF